MDIFALLRHAVSGATDTGLCKSCVAAVARRRGFSALIFSAMLVVGGAAPAGAAENYRGSDPDSYECSPDYRILNRFSAPAGVRLSRSTRYADVKFTLKKDIISLKDASNSKDLAYIIGGENTKYCVFKKVKIDEYDSLYTAKRCAIKYFSFHMRIVIDRKLPVKSFYLIRSGRFDAMDHHIDVSVYRAVDWRRGDSAAGCNELSGTPDIPYFRLRFLNLKTITKSDVIVDEEAPLKLRGAETYSNYERESVVEAGRDFLGYSPKHR